MKKKARDLKQGNVVLIAGITWRVQSIEISDIGKQGSQKCRLELINEKGEKSVIIRPADYPFDLA